MVEKKKIGIYMPIPLMGAMETYVLSQLRGDEKSIGWAAAALALLSLSQKERNVLIQALKAADSPGGDFHELVAKVSPAEAGRKPKVDLLLIDKDRHPIEGLGRSPVSGKPKSRAKKP